MSAQLEHGFYPCHPNFIPQKVKRAAYNSALGGPPDDEGGYDAPRTIIIYFCVNWEEVMPEWPEESRFAFDGDDATAAPYIAEASWVPCAVVYPVMKEWGV
jgi:hypothetical protein